jgi:hypothetical protein
MVCVFCSGKGKLKKRLCIRKFELCKNVWIDTTNIYSSLFSLKIVFGMLSITYLGFYFNGNIYYLYDLSSSARNLNT